MPRRSSTGVEVKCCQLVLDVSGWRSSGCCAWWRGWASAQAIHRAETVDMSIFQSVGKRLLRYFLAGAFAILPLVVTIAIVIWVAGFLQRFLGQDTLIGRAGAQSRLAVLARRQDAGLPDWLGGRARPGVPVGCRRGNRRPASVAGDDRCRVESCAGGGRHLQHVQTARVDARPAGPGGSARA